MTTGGLAAACLLWAGLAGNAGAATTIGSDLGQAPNTVTSCSNYQYSCAYSQASLPGRQIAAPSDGVLVSWRTRVSFSRSRYGTLRVLRPIAGSYTAIAKSATVALKSGVVTAYALRIPVKAGDVFGMSGTYGSITAFRTGATGAGLSHFSPVLADGSTGTALTAPADRELMLNADIEPDADLDGYGDETQDSCPTDSSIQSECKADLQITTTASSAGIGQFTEMTFFMHVRNIGPQKAFATVARESLPLMRVDAITTDVGSCSVAGGGVSCDFGTLDAGRSANVRIEVTGIARGSSSAVASGSSAVKDPNSANNSAGAASSVLNPGACSNNKSGGSGVDRLVGTDAGDMLNGGPGNDTLEGGVGWDCLAGGPGSDKLLGQKSDDRLNGGDGDDTLDGGDGKDSYSGGSGNDVILSRDSSREKVDCGRGRDRVVADKRDRLKRCEQRSRK